jgi:hypothetical protein
MYPVIAAISVGNASTYTVESNMLSVANPFNAPLKPLFRFPQRHVPGADENDPINSFPRTPKVPNVVVSNAIAA